jgi:hypothetical protein
MTRYYKDLQKNADFSIPRFPLESCSTVKQNSQQLEKNIMVIHANTFIKVLFENQALGEKTREMLRLIAHFESQGNVYAKEVENFLCATEKMKSNCAPKDI